jgi:hypothetical protein
MRATFAEPARRTVNLWLDADSVRPGLALDDPEVVQFQGGGGIIEPYEVPVPPPTLDQIDTKLLNEALAAEGSVVRAIAELMLIEVNKLRADHARPPYTKLQFVAALKAQMRTA